MTRIRSVEKDDAFGLLVFQTTLDSETKYMLFEPGERKSTREDIEKRIEGMDKDSLFLVVEDDDKIVGFLTANRGHANRIKHCAYIVVGILKDFRGKGIGKELFLELNKWALSKGIKRLELTVMIPNEPAIALYKKAGFRIEGVKEKSCFVDGTYVDEYYMSKIL